ncbi:MAG: translation elongation factor Ts [Phycisphaerae bacterium]
MEITASMVKDLREQTGLPMMECKKALTEAAGDVNKAIDWLKERGMKKLAARADNVTPNGKIFLAQSGDGKRVAMVAIGCETEPVTATDDFLKLGNNAAQAALQLDNPTPEAIKNAPMSEGTGTVGEFLDSVLNRIREKIVIVDAATEAGDLGKYVHHNGMVGVLVKFSGPVSESAAADTCMHIAAMNPRLLKREDVPSAEVEEQRQAFVKEVAGKPENIINQIVDGKMGRWYSEFVLLEQPFVKDDKKSVQQMLNDDSKGLTISSFRRFKIGA